MEPKNISPELQAALLDLKESLSAEARTEINNQIDKFYKPKGIQIPGMDQNSGVKGMIDATIRSNEQRIRDFMLRKTAGDLILETKAAGDMGMGNVTGGTASISSVLPGITANAPRKQHLGELLQRINITGDLVALRENGTGEGAIAAVADGAPKPQRDYDLIETTFPANYIAGYARVSRRFMISVPGATQFLTSRLLEDYLTAEDYYLLFGAGVPPEIKGINVTGNFTAATSLAADNDYVQLIKGVGQLAALGRNPDLIIMHPDNLYALMVNTATGSGEFDSPQVVQINPDGSMRVAGVAVITSTAQTVGTYTIIDRAGFIIGVLDSLNVRFFEEDQDNVIKNLVTVRVESNIAFAVLAATYAVTGTFTDVVPFTASTRKK